MSWFEEPTLEEVTEECQFWQEVELKIKLEQVIKQINK